MKSVRSILPAIMVVALLPLVPAQQDSQARPLPDRTLMTLDFPGGDIGQFVQLLRQKSGTVNILLSSGHRDLPVPPMSMERVTIPSALEAMQILVESRSVNVRIKDVHDPVGSTVYVVNVEVRDAPSNQRTSGGNVVGGQDDVMVRVFSLKGLTDPMPGLPEDEGFTVSPETVLTAVDTGLGLGSSESKATVRYHRDSGLLFVQGGAEQVQMVQQVLGEMQSALERFRAAAQSQQRSKVAANGPANKAADEANAPAKAR